MTTPPDWDADVIEHSLTTGLPADYRPRAFWLPGLCGECDHGVHGAVCASLDPVMDELCGCPFTVTP